MNIKVGKTLLLVEDEAVIAMMEQMALEKYHYKVMVAHTGKKAVEMALTIPEIDLILMDINLGRGIDGTEAAAQILQNRHIPIVFLSSHTSQDIVEMTERITSYGYVVKDSGITVLDASIKMAFKLFDANEKFRLELAERERAEEYLRESEERFHALFERAPLGYQSLDEEGNFVEVNQAWLETLGYTRDEVIGKWFGDFLAPEYVQAFRKRFPEFLARGHIHSEFYMLHKNGEWRYIAFDGRVGRHPDGSFKQTHCILKDETERKRAEEALRASEERYHQLVEISPDLIAVHQEGKIVFINTSGAHLLGATSPEEVIGMPIVTFLPADRVAIGEARVSQLFEVGHAPIYEQKLRRLDGAEIDIEVTGVAFSYHGAPAVQIVAHDITTYKQTEAALHESNERLRLANKATNDVIWDWDIVHDTQMWNEAGAIVFGWTDIVQKPQSADWWMQRVHPGERQRVAEGFFAVVNNPAQSHWQDEYRFRKADGDYAQIMDRGYVLRDAEGNAIRMIGAMLDITERKQAEEALRESEEKHRALVAGLPDIVMRFDRAGRHLFVSKNVVQVTDLPAAVFLGKTHREMGFPEQLCTFWEDSIRQVFDSAVPIETEFAYESPHGEIIFNWRLLPEFDTRGNVQFVLSVSRDITAHKRAEAIVQHQIEEKEVLLKEVHHRIKNNFASIEGLLCLQAEASDTPEAVSVLQDAISRVRSMRVLYERLLLSGEYRDLSTRPYLETLINAIFTTFPDTSSINLTTQIDDFPLDARRLFVVGIVVNELLTNAMKYAFAGRDGGSLQVALAQVALATDAARITLTVQDDGPGFESNSPHGFGLRIIEMLCQQVAGSFACNRESGARCVFAFDV